MFKAVFVIAIMVIINVFMVFAVFKVAAKLNDSLRRYFVVKIGSSEYSKVRVNKNYGTIVGEESDDAETEGEGEGFDEDLPMPKGKGKGTGVGDGEGDGEGEEIEGLEGEGGPGKGKGIKTITSFAGDQVQGGPGGQGNGQGNGPGGGYGGMGGQSTQNIYNRIDLETERVRIEQEMNTVSSIPVAEDLSVARYKNNDLKDDYKTIRQLSSLDKASAVEAVQNIQTLEGEEHSRVVLSIKDILDYDSAFRLATFDNEQQESILRQTFTPAQQRVLDDFINQTSRDFDAVEFYGYIQNLSEMCDTNYYVYTSNEGEQYIGLGDSVTPVYDEEIAEGIKVIYRNKLYDYSI